MEYSLEILKIIEGAIKLDKSKVINYASLLASKLDESGDSKTAIRFRKLIDSNRDLEIQPLSAESLYKIPIDQESRLPMADVYNPSEIDDSIILNKDIKLQVTRIFEYYQNIDKIMSSGLTIPNSILMYGPPGCGKTKLAKSIGKHLNLTVVITRLDGLISSFLGNTSKNIRAIFEYAHRVPCVLFLDEFDALAKIRDDQHELGELKRVVNSLLQNIDSLNNGSILIAATNHDHLLDPAVWRRFSFKLHIEKPDYDSRIDLIKLFLKNYSLNDNDLALLAHLFKSLSGSDIEEICHKSLMDSVVKEQNLDIAIATDHFFEFIDLLKDKEKEDLTERDIEKIKSDYLRELNPKIFSYAHIGKLLNRSKSHIGNLLSTGGQVDGE